MNEEVREVSRKRWFSIFKMDLKWKTNFKHLLVPELVIQLCWSMKWILINSALYIAQESNWFVSRKHALCALWTSLFYHFNDTETFQNVEMDKHFCNSLMTKVYSLLLYDWQRLKSQLNILFKIFYKVLPSLFGFVATNNLYYLFFYFLFFFFW